MKLKENQRPEGSKGLYSPDYEHDGCGVGLVVKIDGSKHHSIVDQGLSVLEHIAIAALREPTTRRATAPESWCRSLTNISC